MNARSFKPLHFFFASDKLTFIWKRRKKSFPLVISTLILLINNSKRILHLHTRYVWLARAHTRESRLLSTLLTSTIIPADRVVVWVSHWLEIYDDLIARKEQHFSKSSCAHIFKESQFQVHQRNGIHAVHKALTLHVENQFSRFFFCSRCLAAKERAISTGSSKNSISRKYICTYCSVSIIVGGLSTLSHFTDWKTHPHQSWALTLSLSAVANFVVDKRIYIKMGKYKKILKQIERWKLRLIHELSLAHFQHCTLPASRFTIGVFFFFLIFLWGSAGRKSNNQLTTW